MMKQGWAEVGEEMWAEFAEIQCRKCSPSKGLTYTSCTIAHCLLETSVTFSFFLERVRTRQSKEPITGYLWKQGPSCGMWTQSKCVSQVDHTIHILDAASWKVQQRHHHTFSPVFPYCSAGISLENLYLQ